MPRIFNSFTAVSFDVLKHQNECIDSMGSFSGQLHFYLGILRLSMAFVSYFFP